MPVRPNKYFEIKPVTQGKEKGRFNWFLVNRGRVVGRSACSHARRADAERTCRGVNPAIPIRAA